MELLILLVALDDTPVTAGAGGPVVARLAAGVEVEERGPARGTAIPIALRGEVSLEGWVRRDRLGCRAGADVELAPVGTSPPAKLRRGALLSKRRGDRSSTGPSSARRSADRGELIEVETAGPIAIRGTIPASACVVPGRSYADETPREGELLLLARETDLTDAPEGAVRIRLPAGTRFNARERREGWARGRTDGPVLIDGWVRADDLGGPPQGSPLDVLVRPLDHTHEILAPVRLRPARRARPGPVELGGGAAVNVAERAGDLVRVRTVGPVMAEGWVPAEMVREVTAAAEESIDIPREPAQRTPLRRGPRLTVP